MRPRNDGMVRMAGGYMHKLSGNYKGCNECHVEPDWLLIYQLEGKLLKLIDTGTHSDLFKK